MPQLTSLDRNQLILRLAEMQVISVETGKIVVISVQQKIPLAAPGRKKPQAVRRAATVQPTPRNQTPSLSVGPSNPKLNGTMLPPAQENNGREVAKFPSWQEDAIQRQQIDIDRISGAVARIEKDMSLFKGFMAEVRAELAANRATRKTQQDLNQEQFAWFQEDMKELRQDNGDFQQELREEELPDIRHQLEQLRQEIGSKDRFTELPDPESLSSTDVNKHLGMDIIEMTRKFNELDGLKIELQNLQKRLKDMEEKKQDPFVLPRTLMNAPPRILQRPSNAGAQPRNSPTEANSIPGMVIEGPENTDARSVTVQNGPNSPSLPGAFPDSVTDLEAPASNGTAGLHATSSTARHEPKSAEYASPRSTHPQKWSFAGLPRWQSVKSAFEAFGLEYPKLGVPESVRILEDHVNSLFLQNTATGLHYGKVASVGDNGKDGTHHNEAKFSHSKRKHDQIRDGEEPLPWGHMRKKRRQLGLEANDQSILELPPTIPGPSDQRVAVIISSVHSSPGHRQRESGILMRSENEEPTSPRPAVPNAFPVSSPISNLSKYDLQSTFVCGSCGKIYQSSCGLNYVIPLLSRTLPRTSDKYSELTAYSTNNIPNAMHTKMM